MIKRGLRRLRLLLLVGAVHVFVTVGQVRRQLSRRPRRGGSVAVIGAYGNGNYGDDAIGLGIARSLAGHGLSATFLGRLPDGERLLEAPGSTFVSTGTGITGIWRAGRGLRGASAAILGGGGLLEGQRDSVHVHRLVLEYVAKLTLAGARGLPTYVHGIGVSKDLFSDPAVTGAVVRALRSVDGISVRDVDSERVLAGIGVTARLVRDPALAILHEWGTTVQPAPGSVAFVGLDRVRWPAFAPGDPRTEDARRREIGDLVGQLRAFATGARVLELVPFHSSDPPFLEAIRTALLASGLPEELRVEPVSAYPLRSARDAFRGLVEAERILTMRFHPALATLTVGRQVEVVGGLQKLAALRASAVPTSEVFPSTFGDPDDSLRCWLGQPAATGS